MHQKTLFLHQKSKKNLGKETQPLSRFLLHGDGTLLLIPHPSSAPATTRFWLRHCI